MPWFKLTLEYDGTDFAGWQTQAQGERTVQGVLAIALAEFSDAPVKLTGAGRTDAGVHAEGQVASVALETRLEPETLARALNAKLPGDVAVLAAEFAGDDFDARRAARGKLYRYQVWNARTRSPLRERRWHHEPRPLDVAAMRAAAQSLVGHHDFASFQAAGAKPGPTERRLWRCDPLGEAGAELRFELHGDGFLRHMVRNVVGTLLEVGAGARPADSLASLLAARDRRLAGPTAPACGLCLARVEY